jgi:hypothetical protein
MNKISPIRVGASLAHHRRALVMNVAAIFPVAYRDSKAISCHPRESGDPFIQAEKPIVLAQFSTYDHELMKRVFLFVSIAIATNIVAPRPAVAQVIQAVPRTIRAACLDTTSAALTLPVVVYVRADVADSVAQVIGPIADVFAQSVGQRLRELLHGRGDTIPPGEPTITWRNISDENRLIVRIVRDSEPVYELASPHVDSVAAAMLLTAAHIASDSGEAPLWTQISRSDTMVFGIRFELIPASATTLPDDIRAVFPVFSVMFPPRTPVRPDVHSEPEYPDDLRRMGVSGYVIASFEVDTAGHPLPETIKDVWPASKERLTGALLTDYNEFAQSVFKSIKAATFTPARLGGCAVPQLVVQPVTFSLRH